MDFWWICFWAIIAVFILACIVLNTIKEMHADRIAADKVLVKLASDLALTKRQREAALTLAADLRKKSKS